MKGLKKFLRSITFISLLITETGYSQFLFTPFENESSYKGTWNLSQEIPNYIAAYLREFYKVNVLSSTAFLSLVEKNNINETEAHDFQAITSIANEIDFGYFVIGKVNDFDIARFSAGESNIAGYEAYSCEISISLQIFDLSKNTIAFAGNVESSVSNKGLGLNLFGGSSDEKKQYLALNKIRFGSEEFNKTIVGETMLILCEDLALDIKSSKKEILFPKRESKKQIELEDKTLDEFQLKIEIKKGQLLTYDESSGEAFINLGFSSNINVVMNFPFMLKQIHCSIQSLKNF
ncbi:MAG: hypothetical protein A2315_15830 [Ignavibacteria bacterium RIFOXYB2_FULL_35_12]|nr:MAG: hypothetical protein A2058_00310 [Ignavibacteria bacterium GWA2_36_19]OGU58745.1 MAG: hypothetical protein A2X60_17255 [Ignavibacteria bacterium GWF2_35_20]OGU84518.1 MAG: hypothetical protein A3K31_08830 [Ignavibacteria bacterium RIFOXYA12_FULL_35_25]OGU92043.1 MAG: hypothetical protein A2492_01290 [Ignavibacteria bacterium RIFOXYC12_FULL_35_11]OGU95653.1 MAG: hypothetical protein A2347_00445 [Ignavibacteria bacterium RIFOXYB12_FULL_35_14]OGU99107.1 MAG: hypothetical protein A2455_073